MTEFPSQLCLTDKVKMDSAVTRRRSGPFLPDITTNSVRWRRSSQNRTRLEQESLQARSVSNKWAQIFSKEEIAQFRNSVKQNICVQMLQEGYHRSFSELSFLLQSERDRRAAAEPGSALRLQTPLEEQQDKLETMRQHLSRAEQAERIGSWSVVCEHRLVLGQYFSAPEDLLLSLYFYHSCADREQGGRSRPATEARACMAELYLQQAEDKQIEGEAAYRLGLAYQRTGDHDTAKKLFNTCMQICGTLQDADGLGKAYKAMAKSIESEGNINETIQCLQKLVDIMRSNGLQPKMAESCLCLGNIYFTTAQYRRACECFLQSYDVACNIGNMALLQKAQVSVGSARAHSLIRTYAADVASASPTALQRLMTWKNTRGHQDLSLDSTDPAAWY
ncbi:tetratricopeptide repeat protein 29 isoform X4 [Toxotes jaculatrix]|uniref:tetratricopeptide repeat protein 29 isoform X4 n=1 Tax=Toxotes jaculatrix TaxID=941984 RepID=UPI001B3AB85E|nr:tetratricopeptide repeat protein 29 isoform X4 [Toxotes jaculatrix]